ncbi:unnamed protein product [Psylliodes chrysocephalus]|uniref:Right handed beta helix domain-containing protein n=1 Tax=Psylliodes chrysocephalus TaxID=3402493 RepID=A0A9P0CVF1_9CUCU|nr:unnamed protein product [Psylliodes chrysocephala]
MYEIITFDKSFQQRLSEFNDVLSACDVLPTSQLQKQWGLFLEFSVDKRGWQAIWKLPRTTCESLNIIFPSLALVIVLTVKTLELKAYIRILAFQNDVNIPEKMWVPLVQIWPTEDQDKSIDLNLMETANSLDMLRFFYLYVFMPWDRDEDDNQDWKDKHLESRLRFYYDLKNGNIPRGVAEHIHNLLTEARRLHNKREFLEGQISKAEENQNSECDSLKDERTKTLIQIHVRLLEIRTDIEVAENPLLRNIIIDRFSQLGKISLNPNPQIWLIFDQGTAEEHMNFLMKVQQVFPKDNLKFCTNLASKLESANKDDTYLLNESVHKISTTGALEEGGTVRGIGCRENIIFTTEVEDVMLDFIGEKVVLENLTIDVNLAQCGVLVRKGNCYMKKCKIIGKSSSPIYQGIIALKGASLHMENCEISGFSTAIIGNSGSNIILKNCDIHDVDYGLKIFDESKVSLDSVSIRECSDFGICLETESLVEVVGGFKCLEETSEVIYKNVTGVNNGRGDVAILHQPELKPIENLFADPNNDPTIIESDDDITM